MENIKIKEIKGIKGLDTCSKYDKFIKLSNNIFITRESQCLKLFNIKNSKINHISWSKKLYWSPIAILELKNKNIITSGRNFIAIFKIEKNKFILIQELFDSTWAELTKIIELSNGKIIIASILGDLKLLEIKNGKYEIKKNINILGHRNYDIEHILENEILLIEKSKINANRTKLSILDFSRDKINKKILNKQLFSFKLFKTNIFNLQNGFLIIQSNRHKDDSFDYKKNKNNYCLYIFNIKYKEIIAVFEIGIEINDIIHYKDDIYLCAFDNIDKIGFISFKDEFIIKETKSFKKPFQFLMVNNDIYLYCKNN